MARTFSRAAFQLHVGRDTVAQRGQRGSELDDVFVLVLVAQLAPFRVVAVLLAAPRIEPRRLDVAVRRGADPDGFVGRRDTDGLDASDFHIDPGSMLQLEMDPGAY